MNHQRPITAAAATIGANHHNPQVVPDPNGPICEIGGVRWWIGQVAANAQDLTGITASIARQAGCHQHEVDLVTVNSTTGEVFATDPEVLK